MRYRTTSRPSRFTFRTQCRRPQDLVWMLVLGKKKIAFGGKSKPHITKQRKATMSFVMSDRLSAWNNSARTAQIFIKFDTGVFFEKLSGKFTFKWNRIRMTGTLLEDQRFLSHLTQFCLEWEVFQTKVAEEIKTHTLCSIFVFLNRAVFEIMWKNVVEWDRLLTIRRMIIACWIPKATDTHSQYVTFTAFPLQQRLNERAWMLRYTYVDCPPWKITNTYLKNTK